MAVPFVSNQTWRLKKLSQRYPNILRVQKTFSSWCEAFKASSLFFVLFELGEKAESKKVSSPELLHHELKFHLSVKVVQKQKKVLSSKTVFTKVHGPNR